MNWNLVSDRGAAILITMAVTAGVLALADWLVRLYVKVRRQAADKRGERQ